MAKSTADLENWRAMPQYFPRSDQSTMDLFNFLRGQSWGTMGTINKMPMVFDPTKFWSGGIGQVGTGLGTTPEEQQAVIDNIRNAIKPGSGAPGGGLLSMLGPGTLSGVLGMLGVKK